MRVIARSFRGFTVSGGRHAAATHSARASFFAPHVYRRVALDLFGRGHRATVAAECAGCEREFFVAKTPEPAALADRVIGLDCFVPTEVTAKGQFASFSR
jgi:hypothetical protein